ncbi:MAG TPA: site-specific integrase [Clostridiales bacterium]|nr:site-specific integrase [Clostridiales bacterium]
MAERRDTKNRLLGKGEYQKSDGRYMYRYVDSRGNSRFVYSWMLTQTDRPPKGKNSDKCLREMEKEIAKDLQDEIDSFKARKMTLNAFYENYIEQKQELKTSTRTNYKYMYKKYVWDSIGRRKLPEINYSDIKKFYNQLIREVGFKPNSMETIHTILHTIFSTAVRDGYIRVNPTDGVMAEIKKSHDWEKPKRHALTIQEQEAFVEFTKSHDVYKHWLSLFTVLLGTGCRVGEVVGLTWDDCDFKNGIININHSLIYRPDEYTGKAGFYISTPKTKAGEREIPMFDAVKKALLDERLKQMRDGFNQTVIDGYSGFIFSNRFSSVLSPHNINRAIDRITRDYNVEESELAERQNKEPLLLPHFSVHNLRHTFCTRMCENEPNIKIIQEIMGHSDITTTMDIYNEATRDKKQESFAGLEGKMKIC